MTVRDNDPFLVFGHCGSYGRLECQQCFTQRKEWRPGNRKGGVIRKGSSIEWLYRTCLLGLIDDDDFTQKFAAPAHSG